MGSPISHIIGHYFPTRFDILDRNKVPMGKWTNIYRVDDFVGTVIGDENQKWSENKSVDAGGHTGYWTDQQVHKILLDEALPELKPAYT